ncbi:MAG TPA: flagellar M-ring protein FliF [Methylococcaceae bacterium]|nr:flagellar M-ring protein FliF [Methylococcaceae bacterium]HIO12733.1 flagellar M-ring protein FliF [Methylococcales bacterium]
MAEQPAITADTNTAPRTDPLLEQPDGQGVAVNSPPGALTSTANATAPTVASSFFQQPAVQKSIPAVVVIVVLLISVMVYSLFNSASFRPLFEGISQKDQSAIYTALIAADIPVKLDPVSGNVTVSTDDYHEAKLLLASQGLPESSIGGFNLIRKDQSMGTSQFMEKMRYKLAMEEELATSIATIDSIRRARVHLAIPKQSVFIRNREASKASVVVFQHQGRTITTGQVEAIIHMVASSIPFMEAESVSVVDSHGKLLHSKSSSQDFNLSNEQLQYRNQIEDMYRTRVLSILSTFLGKENIHAEVNAEVDYTLIESTSQFFNPKTISLRSEQMSGQSSSSPGASGVPGFLSNNPLTPAGGAGNQTSGSSTGSSTRNYEVDKTIRHEKKIAGVVTRLAVAVVIDQKIKPPPVPTEANSDEAATSEEASKPTGPVIKVNGYKSLADIEALVKGAIGFDASRGDTVTIMEASFTPQLVAEELAWWRDVGLQGIGRQLVIAAIFILLILTVFKPVVTNLIHPEAAKKAFEDQYALDHEQENLLADALNGEEPDDPNILQDGESLEEMKARLKPKKSAISADMLDTANSYDDKVALVRMLVNDDSRRVANVMRAWIRKDLGV